MKKFISGKVCRFEPEIKYGFGENYGVLADIKNIRRLRDMDRRGYLG